MPNTCRVNDGDLDDEAHTGHPGRETAFGGRASSVRTGTRPLRMGVDR